MVETGQDVYQQYRSVKVRDLVAESRGEPDDMDLRVHVRQNQDQSALTFDVTLWNLSGETWQSIRKGDGVKIVLGWEDGPTATVCLGAVGQKRTERDENDIKYILQGKDISANLLNMKISKAWKNQQIHELVRDIAGDLGLSVGNIDPVPGQFPSGRCVFWAIKDDRPVSDWLDQLVAEAEKRTDTKWTWRAEKGRLWFEKASKKTVEATTLSYDNTLLSLSEASGSGESGEEESGAKYEFTAMSEPSISEGTIVYVDTDDIAGGFKAVDVEHTSDSTDGTHETSGRLSQALGYSPTRPSGEALDEQMVQRYKAQLRDTGAL